MAVGRSRWVYLALFTTAGALAPCGVESARAGSILFLVADAANLNASDGGVNLRLARMGHNVTVLTGDDSVTDDASGKDGVIISSTLNSGTVRGKFEAVAVPLINWEQALMADFGMSTGNNGTIASQNSLSINPNEEDHPLAAGLTAAGSPHTVLKDGASVTFSTGSVADLAPGALLVATLGSDAARAGIYVADAGATLIGNGTGGTPMGAFPAPATRIMFFMEDNTFTELNDVGLSLFDAAVNYALGLDPLVAGDVNRDSIVDLSDYAVIRDNFLTGSGLAQGDLNFDGRVDLVDFQLWRTAFQAAGGAPANVPEPSAVVLLVLGLIAAPVGRRFLRGAR